MLRRAMRWIGSILQRKKNNSRQISSSFTIESNVPFAHGAYSKVYRGLYANKNVAIKNVDADPKKAANFKSQQIQIMLKLQELSAPNVIELLAYSRKKAPYSIIMPLMVHGSLVSHIVNANEAKFSQSLRFKILVGVAEAFAFLHAHFIIHCDIKSGNILLNEDYAPFVADFDVAMQLKSASMRSAIGKNDDLRGTYIYMAPEILQRKYYSADSDVYSFAILIWETLAWKLAARSLRYLQRDELIESVVNGYREQLPRKWPENITKLIAKSWDNSPESRPSMHAIHSELQEHSTKLKLL